MKERRIGAVILTTAEQVPDPGVAHRADRERNVVERHINRLKQYRRIATRDETRAVHVPAMLTVAAILRWL